MRSNLQPCSANVAMGFTSLLSLHAINLYNAKHLHPASPLHFSLPIRKCPHHNHFSTTTFTTH
eukprot:6458772-Amphidinium_carterae.2